MIKYPDWVFRQSAVLPYRWRDDALEILLITSRRGRRWLLPKGIVEPGFSARASAAKEAHEEAGIEGALWETPLGSYRQDKWGGTCCIEVFPMQVTRELDDWPESGIRRRKWLSRKAARKRIESKPLRAMLEQLTSALDARGRPQAEPTVTVIEQPRLLYLLRHAKSSWDDPTLADFDRPLAARGRAACETMSEYLRLAAVAPELVLCSPAVRTRETLAGVQAALGDQAQTRFDEQLYLEDPRILLERLRSVPADTASVMLISHNPGMEELALELVEEDESEARARMASKFPTAALAILTVQGDTWQALGPGSCRLHSFVVPRELTP